MRVGAPGDDAVAVAGESQRRARARSRARGRCTRRTRARAPRWNATALAAMMCMSGPPCSPGKTTRSRSLAHRLAHRTSPPRGPRSVLCVVEVTKSQCGTGLGCRPVTTIPAMCAMSAMTFAPTSRAIAAIRCEVDHARVGRRAADDELRAVLLAPALGARRSRSSRRRAARRSRRTGTACPTD